MIVLLISSDDYINYIYKRPLGPASLNSDGYDIISNKRTAYNNIVHCAIVFVQILLNISAIDSFQS